MNVDLVNTVPKLKLLCDYADYYAEHTPEVDAAIVDDRHITYRELAGRVAERAKALMAAGVQPGDRVATLVPPHPDFLLWFLATGAVGATWMGLNPRYQYQEYDYVVSDAEPRVLISRGVIGDREFKGELQSLQTSYPCIEQLVILEGNQAFADSRSEAEFIDAGKTISDRQLAERRAAVDPNDPVLLVYTSGTTGNPKGALISHYGLISLARIQRGYWDVDPVSLVNFLPVNHLGCVGDLASYVFVNGGTTVFMEQFDPRDCLVLTEKHQLTLFGGVPTTLQLSLDVPDFDRFDLSSVQMIVWSGAAIPEPMLKQLRRICPHLSSSYSQTESVGGISFTTRGCSDEVYAETVGKPVPGYELKLADAEGNEVDLGEVGEIRLRADYIMLGYLNHREATLEAIDSDGWLHTGDLGVMREDGNIKLVGRIKEMFKSGGYNVYPREVEGVLESHPGVAIAAVLGIPDALYGEKGVAFVIPSGEAEVAKADEETLDEEALNEEALKESLKEYCRGQLANYKIPKWIDIREELPLLPIGKVDKKALKAIALAEPAKTKKG